VVKKYAGNKQGAAHDLGRWRRGRRLELAGDARKENENVYWRGITRTGTKERKGSLDSRSKVPRVLVALKRRKGHADQREDNRPNRAIGGRLEKRRKDFLFDVKKR